MKITWVIEISSATLCKCNWLGFRLGCKLSFIFINYHFPCYWLYNTDQEASGKPQNLCSLPSTILFHPFSMAPGLHDLPSRKFYRCKEAKMTYKLILSSQIQSPMSLAFLLLPEKKVFRHTAVISETLKLLPPQSDLLDNLYVKSLFNKKVI